MEQQPYMLHLGDCLEVLRTPPDASVDSIVTDPPMTIDQLAAATGTGNALPACLARALAPMAPPQSVIHQIIQEDDLLAADRARNVNKAERAIEREAERALDLQIKHQNLPGAYT